MLVVNLIGGLGNQMFQYAFGRALAKEKSQAIQFDTTELLDRSPKEQFTYRDFELGIFTGSVPIASASTVALFKHKPAGLLARVQYKVLRRLYTPVIYREKAYYVFDPAVWQQRGSVYYDGYWQAEGYFRPHAADIRQHLAFRTPPSGQNALLAQQIQAQPAAVSVHVRRGDYVANAQSNQAHGTCSPTYYAQAVQLIKARFPDATLYVFSDEPAWVRQHLSFGEAAVYISHNHGKDSFEDMRLMSLCRHHIIANSSFSWWGAWLNPRPDKLVVAPRQWLRQLPPGGFPDLFPPQWIQL